MKVASPMLDDNQVKTVLDSEIGSRKSVCCTLPI